MTSKRYIAAAFSCALTACGPDGRSVGDSCPDLPLYRFVYDHDAGTWTRILVTASDASEPVSGSAAEDIAKAEAHCITGAGTAESINSSRPPGSGGSGSTGTGGAPSDAGVD